jgi:hypothetical protein
VCLYVSDILCGAGHHQSGPHHYRSQPRQQHPRNDNYRQRGDYHHMPPNHRSQHTRSQSHNWNRGRPNFFEAAPRYQANQERFNGWSPERSYRPGERQEVRAQGFIGGVQPDHGTSSPGQVGQYCRNSIAPDVRDDESLSGQVTEKSQEELPSPDIVTSVRPSSNPADSPDVGNMSMYEPSPENSSKRISPQPCELFFFCEASCIN